MTTLELKYNPFAIKTDFFIDGKEASLRCFGTGSDVRLREYIGDFFPEAMKKTNLGPGSECVVQFYGTQDAFEDVKAACHEYGDQNEGIKIELPEYRPYPNNFNEMNLLIAEKREKYAAQIAAKKDGLVNPATMKGDIDILDLEKRFDRDKKALEQAFVENGEKAKAVLDKAKEGSVSFASSTLKTIGASRCDYYGASISEALKLNCGHKIGNKCDTDCRYLNFGLGSKKKLSSSTVETKAVYVTIIETVNASFAKNSKELSELLSSLFDKAKAAFHSCCKDVCEEYIARFSDLLPLADSLKEYKTIWKLGMQETIPDSCFDSIAIKDTASMVLIGRAKQEEAIKKVSSACNDFAASSFDLAAQAFIAETEKCRDYYLGELLELQATIKEKLVSTKQIEQEISMVQSKIECLDDLQTDLNKLVTG